ncbi:hypothetical protein OQA88_1269 [Cercophora sp. LCS_1]
MRVSTIALGALTATTSHVAADRLSVIHVHRSQNAPDTPRGDFYTGFWHNDFGNTYSMQTLNNGCGYPNGIPGVYEFCFDGPNQRAHFFAPGQPKRCFAERGAVARRDCVYNDYCDVWFKQWPEVPC